MTFEDIIKQKTDEIVNKMKLVAMMNGEEFGQRDETFFRQGVSYAVNMIGNELKTDCTNLAYDPYEEKEDEHYSKLKSIIIEYNNTCPKCGKELKFTRCNDIRVQYPYNNTHVQYSCSHDCGFIVNVPK